MTDLTIPERVRTIYHEVWHEFFDWELEYSRQMLMNLDLSDGVIQRPLLPLDVSEVEKAAASDTTSSTDCIQLWNSDLDADTSTELLSCPTYSCTSLEPVKTYEACTYSHKNLYVADDLCEKLQFMPFSDDPRFPATEFFESFDSMGWDTRKDPDRELQFISF